MFLCMCTQAAISGMGLMLNYVCYVVILVWYIYRIVVDVVSICRSLTAGGKLIVAEVHTCVGCMRFIVMLAEDYIRENTVYRIALDECKHA